MRNYGHKWPLDTMQTGGATKQLTKWPQSQCEAK